MQIALSFDAIIQIKRIANATFDKRYDLTMTLPQWRRLWLEVAEEYLVTDVPNRKLSQGDWMSMFGGAE